MRSRKPWNPHDYQKKAVEFLVRHACAGLFLDPGLGKTSVVLRAFQALKKMGLVQTMIVIAPLRVCYNVWPSELEKWAEFEGLTMQLLHGSDKYWRVEQPADIYVINPDGLPWLIDNGYLKKLDPCILVVDESTKFKNTQTKRFKLLKPFIGKFSRRWILTGTPTPNGYLDLFGQMYIVDMGRSLGQFVTHYRFSFFSPTGYGGYTWVLKEDADKAIQERIRPSTMRLDAEDYVKMPSLLESNIVVELPEKAVKIYEQLEEQFFATLDQGQIVTAVSAASVGIKCRQVASGGLYYHPDFDKLDVLDQATKLKRQAAVVHNAKTEALTDLIESIQGAPLLVAYQFDHDLERIKEALGDVPNLSGVNPAAGRKIEKDWNAGKIPVLLGHPASVGHGLNLQDCNCRHIVWYSLTYDYEQYDQFIRRVRRQGNESDHVNVYHIVAKKTIDTAILRAIKTKRKDQNALLDALRYYREGIDEQEELP